MARGKGRTAGIVAAAAAVLAIALGFTSGRTDDAGATPGATSSAASANLAKQLLLRLHELPLGYILEDFGSPGRGLPFSRCDRIRPGKPMPRLASFLERYSPRGCAATYVRIFHVPGTGPAPLFVGSAAADLGSVKAAEAGLAVSRELLSALTNGELPEEAEPPELIGDETRLFHWPGSEIPDPEEPLSMVVWRWGDSIGLTVVMGRTIAAGDSAAVEFARRQQPHLEAPTPYTAAEGDDTEVALEDPALEVPIYWLERSFAPGRGLPRLRLAWTNSSTASSVHHPAAGLLYTDRLSFDNAETVALNLWTPQQWNARRAKGKMPFEHLHCVRTRKLSLTHGSAVVRAGQLKGRKCRAGGAKTYTAVIRLSGAVVTAETMKICETCFGPADGPYNSFKGMAAVARGLGLRIKPQ